MRKRIIELSKMLLIVGTLSACGGGGGSGPDNPSGPTAPAMPGSMNVGVERILEGQRFNTITDLQFQPYPASSGLSADRLFVVQRGGVILVADYLADTPSTRVFLDISDRVTAGGEQGLLGLAFHPAFASNSQFFVHYTVDTPGTPQRVRISRFTVPDQGLFPNQADAGSEEILLVVDQAAEGPADTNHNGGSLAFSPLNGLLHVALGDGGGANDPADNGQDLGTLSGSILRIDVDNGGASSYAIPPDNPFAGRAGAREEIFAYGLRNPFKFSFDTNGDLWIGDVGQSAFEEINRVPGGDLSGLNFGWDCREGSQAGSSAAPACAALDLGDFAPPVFEYGLPGGQSVTGGFVYRGTEIAALADRYLYGDFVGGQIWAFDPGSGSNVLLLESGLNISSFGRDARGEPYVADFSGAVYRLVAIP